MFPSTRNNFPKSKRILQRKDFQVVLASGEKVITPFLVILGVPNMRGNSRLGVLVSKKMGNAVVRNRLKRRIRDVYRNRVLSSAEVDIVVIPRHRLKQASHDDLVNSWSQGRARLAGKLRHRLSLESKP